MAFSGEDQWTRAKAQARRHSKGSVKCLQRYYRPFRPAQNDSYLWIDVLSSKMLRFCDRVDINPLSLCHNYSHGCIRAGGGGVQPTSPSSLDTSLVGNLYCRIVILRYTIRLFFSVLSDQFVLWDNITSFLNLVFHEHSF